MLYLLRKEQLWFYFYGLTVEPSIFVRYTQVVDIAAESDTMPSTRKRVRCSAVMEWCNLIVYLSYLTLTNIFNLYVI